MPAAELLGSPRRDLRIVQRHFTSQAVSREGDRIGTYRMRACRRHCRNDAAGVEPTAQERAHWNVGEHLGFHGLEEALSQLAEDLLRCQLEGMALIGQLVVPIAHGLKGAWADHEVVTGRHLLDTLDRRPRFGYPQKGQELIEPGCVETPREVVKA